jgi:hypothetical protein
MATNTKRNRNPMATKKNVRLSSYTKNLGKSLGYIGMDIFRSYAPVMSSLASTSKEAASSGYQAIKDFTDSSNTSDFSFKSMKSKTGEIASNVWKNAIDDLKTGKIYNKERADALGDEMISGFLGEDFNLDFNFDFDDWGDDDSFSDEDSTKTQVAAEVQSSKAVISAMDAVGRGISASFTEASIQSADYIAGSAREDTQVLYNLNREGFGTITKALMSINETIYGFSKIGEPLTAHMQNSSLFFTKTSESLNNIEQSLKQIEKNTTPAPTVGSKGYKSNKSLGTMMSDDSGINFTELKDFVTETMDGYKDLANMLIQFVKPTAESGGKNVGLLGTLSTMAVKTLIPKAFSTAIKDLDESIKYALGAGLTKVTNKNFSNPILNLLLGSFMPKRDYKQTINTANYERGPVQWDGIARKALTDVIPTTLLQIYSAITNTDPMRFDYNSGKFIKTQAIAKQQAATKKRYVESAGGDLYEEIKKNIAKSNKSDEEKAKMLQELYTYFEKAFDTSDHNVYTQSHGVDEETYNIIKDTVTAMKAKGGKSRRAINKWVVDANKEATNYANYLRTEEASGFSLQQALHGEFTDAPNKKGTKFTIFGLDEYGHNYYYYLQGIWQYTGFLANNIGSIGKKGKKNKGPVPSSSNLPKIDEAFQDESGEHKLDDSNDIIFGSYDEEEEEAKKLKERNNAIKDWMNDHIKNPAIAKINSIFGSKIDPETFGVVGVINSISTTLDNLIFGSKDNPEGGLFSYMFERTKELFDNTKKWFKENFFDKFKNWFNEKWGDSSFVQETKKSLGKVKNKVLGTTRKIFIGDEGKYSEDTGETDNGTAAYGRKVTKTGTVTVSTGELIVPSELNPYYHGATNKASQMNAENKISHGRYPMYALGTYSADPNGLGSIPTGGLGAVPTGGLGAKPTGGLKSKISGGGLKAKPFTIENKLNMFRKKNFSDNSIFGLLFAGISDAMSKFKATMDDLADKKKIEADKKKLTDKIGNMLEEAGANKGAIGAGATLGFGASILTGGIIGPIAGAALGAGIGFISKSKAAQDFLFGEEDENGERKHQKAYDFFKKQLPDMGVGAAIGAGAGLFMGSPLLGAFLGAGIGFAKSSDTFKNWMFGKQDENGERQGGAIPKEIQDKIKSAAPGIVSGAVLGAVAGPFGIVGNLLLGSALGYSATAGKLHESLFGKGKDDQESVLFIVKDKIFGGLDDIFHNASNRLKTWFQDIGKSIKNKLSDKIDKLKLDAKEGRGGLLTRAFGGFLNIGDKVLDKTVRVPAKLAGDVIGGISDNIARGNLAKGISTWNRKEKRNMTAQERINARKNMGMNKDNLYTRFDSFLVSINDPDKLSYYKKLIMDIKTQPENSVEYQQATDALQNDPEFKKFMDPTNTMSAKVMAKFFKKSGNRIDQLMIDEANREGLSLEQAKILREKKSLDLQQTISNYIKQLIDNGIKISNTEEVADAVNDNESATPGKNIVANANNIVEIPDPETGEVLEYIQTEDGLVLNNGDRDTSEAMNEKRKYRSSILSIPGAIKGVALDVKETLFGDGDKNDGLFGKYIKKAKSFLSTLVSKVIKPILGIVAGVAGIYLVIKGLFGGEGSGSNKFLNFIGSKFGFGAASTNEFDEGGTKTQFIDSNGNLLVQNFDELGNTYYTNEAGEVVDNSEVSRVKAGKDTLLTTFKKGTFRQLATGKPLLATKLLGAAINKMPFGTKITSQLGKAGKNLSNFKAGYVAKAGEKAWALSMGDDLGKSITKSIKNLGTSDGVVALKVKECLDKALLHMDDVPLLPAKVKQVLPSCFDDLAETIGKNSGKFIGKVTQNFSDILPVVNVVMMCVDFVTGYEDARTTLGITAKPTDAQRVVSGLLRLVKNLIPIIGPFIPDDLIVNVFCKWIAPVFGLKSSELMQQREQAKQEVANYNAEHGTNYTVAEYNKAVLNDYTFTERIGNTFKSTKQQIGDKLNNTKNAFKEGGVKAGLREFFNSDEAEKAYAEAGGGINGIWEMLKAQTTGFGVFSEFQSKSMDLIKAAFTGDAQTFFDSKNHTLDSFKDTDESSKISMISPMASMFSKLLGEMPFNTLTVVLTPIAVMTGTIKKGFEKFKTLIDPIKNSFTKIKNSVSTHFDLAKAGDIGGLFSYSTETDDKDPFRKIYKITDFATGTMMLPFGIFCKVGNTVHDFFSGLTSSVISDYTNLTAYKDEIEGYAAEGKIGDILKTSYTASSPLRQIFTFGASFVKIINILKAGFSWLTDSLGNLVESATDTLANSTLGQTVSAASDTAQNIKKSVKTNGVVGTAKKVATNAVKNTKKKLKKIASKWLGGASGLTTDGCATCDGFVSQIDDRYRNISFGGSTVGENGCGPAVAAMASRTMGGNMDMNAAINAAKPYTNANGTSIDYFKNTLNASEIKGTKTVKSALESGRPVILLGRDASNTSKTNSPFGPNNHYVLATGMKNGKVLVNDPENDSPMIYDSSILNKSNVNLTYGGYSRLRGSGTTGVGKTSVSDTIWNTLKAEGFSDAAAAGILGNAQQESTMSPTADAAAYGLFQFEKSTGAANGLESYASSLGKSKDDPETQTKYMLSLFKDQVSAYSGNGTYTYPNGTVTWWPTKVTLDDYKSLSDPKEAAEIFERTYERPSIPMREQRKAYASDFYELYQGTSSTGTNSSSSTSDSNSSSSSSSSDGGILSTLSSIFGSLTNIFNLNGFSMNSDSSSSNNFSTSSGNTGNGVGAQAAANAASNEIGYAESGDNITKFGKWSGCDGQPWCAAFAAWAIAQAFDGSKDKAVKALYNCDNVNYTPTLTQYFKDNNAWYNEPKVGDEVMYGNPGAYHVGLVTAVDEANKTYTSVEGNTNDQVTQKEHSSYMDGNVIGYGRPDYTGATNNIAQNTDKSGEAIKNVISGDEDFKATGSGLLKRGGSSGLLRKAAPSRYAYGKMKGQRFKFGSGSGLTTKNRFRGAGTDLAKTTTNILNKMKSNLTGDLANNGATTSVSYSGVDPALVTELLSAITTLLNSIANNTAPTQQIYDVLVEYIEYVKTGTKSTKNATNTQQVPTSSDEVDTNLANLVTTLAAIARG